MKHKTVIFLIVLQAIVTIIPATAMPPGPKKLSQFTGDLNGDGYTDLVLAARTNYKDAFGFVKVFFGTEKGISDTAGWVYNCDRSNLLEDKYSVRIIGDANRDGMDELCLLLTKFSGKMTIRSHQDLFIFYGKKEGLASSPEVLKVETDDADKYSLRDYIDFDYNGDGYTDILAVSSKRNYKVLESGWTDNDKKLLIYKGGAPGIVKEPEVLKNIDDIFFKDAGDLNNDNQADLLIAEPAPKGITWTQYLGNKNQNPTIKPFIKLVMPTVLSGDRTFNNIAWDYNGDKFDDDYIMRVNASPVLSLKKADSIINDFVFYRGSSNGLSDSIAMHWSYKVAPGSILHMTACGDLNGDGLGDFIMQQFIPRPKEISVMKANILYSTHDGLLVDTNDNFNNLFNNAHLVKFGATDVIALGDLNKDGSSDVLLGADTIAYGDKQGNFKIAQLKFFN